MRTSATDSVRQDALAGAVAGLLATVPMTVAMEAMFRRLPRRERYALPPSQLTARVIERGEMGRRLPRRPHTALTLAVHFAIGAAGGAAAGPFVRRLPLPRPLTGMVAGIGVWATGYLISLPSLGIIRTTTKWPESRRRLMFVAHLVWGGTLGLMLAPGHRRERSQREWDVRVSEFELPGHELPGKEMRRAV
jgi:hypothetical protein